MAQKQWIWHNERTGGVSGVIVDFDEDRIQWFDEPGCACAGSNAEQTLADFMARGPRFLTPPDDVLGEMWAAIQALPTN